MSITNDLARGIFFRDDCETVPPSSDWGAGQFTSKYIAFTGGNQDFNNPDPRAGIYLSSAYARLGTKSYKLQLQKRTDKYGTCCEWVRSEVAWQAPGDLIPANVWKFASVSILIDPSVDLGAGIRYQIAFDHKESPDNLETPFWLGIQGPDYIVAGRHVGGTVKITIGGPVVKERWEDWCLERTWDNGGYIKLYRNGVLVYSKTGDMRTNGAPFARIQNGIYKWAWQNANNQGEGPYHPPADDKPIVIYIDEVRFGSPSAVLADFLIGTTPPDPGPTPPVPGGAIRLNAGGKKTGDYNDDAYSTGGTPWSDMAAPVPEVYKTERFGNFKYEIPIANGDVDVKLHFAEIHFSASGARLFDVFIDDKSTSVPVLNDYDIFAKAGGKNKPIVETIPVTIKDGKVSIRFVTVRDNAKISAIEIVPRTAPPVDVSMYVKSVALRDANVDGQTRKVSVTTFNDGTEQVIEKKTVK